MISKVTTGCHNEDGGKDEIEAVMPAGNKWKWNTESMANNLSNLSVIAALVFALTVSDRWNMVLKDKMIWGRYSSNSEFRKYVVKRMEAQQFNFTWELGGDLQVIDTRSVYLSCDYSDYRSKIIGPQCDGTAEFLRIHFFMEEASVWMTANPEIRDGLNTSDVQRFEGMVQFSIAFTFLSMWISFCLLVLVGTYSDRFKVAAAAKAHVFVFGGAILAALLLVAGIFLYMVATQAQLERVSAFRTTTKSTGDVAIYGLFLGGSIVSTFIIALYGVKALPAVAMTGHSQS